MNEWLAGWDVVRGARRMGGRCPGVEDQAWEFASRHTLLPPAMHSVATLCLAVICAL